ncbi:MAG: ArnT family glycosyltransferase [Candidatus Binatia bacterium]
MVSSWLDQLLTLNEKLDIRDKLLFAVIFTGLLLRLLFAPPIWNRGEAREGLVVQGIVHNQQWILPLRNGELPSKPPLFHWIAASASLLVGESDFSTRLPSAIGAAVMVVVTFLLGRAIAGKLTGWLAVGALLGTYDFWHSAGQARVDMIFSAAVTAAIAGFYFWYRDGKRGGRAGFYLATVCAVLAKGPLGIALVGLAIVGFLAVEKRLPIFFSLWSSPLVGAALIVIGGWYGFAYAVGGEKFFALQVAHENVDRFVGGEAFPRHNMYLDMAKGFATRTLPWNLVLLWSAIRRLRGARENSSGRILHAWWLAMFSLFALAAHTRPVYVLPLVPAIALLAARALSAAFSQGAAPDTTDRVKAFSPTAPTEIRSWNMATWIVAGVVLCDLIVMGVSYGGWRDDKPGNARLVFEKKLRSEAAADSPLFAVPGIDAEDVMVLAYRLKRQIDQRPIICGKRNDYFLTASDPLLVGEARVLATLDSSKIALVRVLGERRPYDGEFCQNQTLPAADKGKS